MVRGMKDDQGSWDHQHQLPGWSGLGRGRRRVTSVKGMGGEGREEWVVGQTGEGWPKQLLMQISASPQISIVTISCQIGQGSAGRGGNMYKCSVALPDCRSGVRGVGQSGKGEIKHAFACT